MKPTLTQKLKLILPPEESRAALLALRQSQRSPFALWCCQLFGWLVGYAEEDALSPRRRADDEIANHDNHDHHTNQ